jgi:hypothetical protein
MVHGINDNPTNLMDVSVTYCGLAHQFFFVDLRIEEVGMGGVGWATCIVLTSLRLSGATKDLRALSESVVITIPSVTNSKSGTGDLGNGGGKKNPVETGISFDPPSPPEFPFFQIISSFSPYESLRDLRNISDSGMIKGAQNRHRKW